MNKIRNSICILIVFAICLTVCACSKKTDIAVETTESETLQTSGTIADMSESEAASVTVHRSEAEISSGNQSAKATRSTSTANYVKLTYPDTLDGYVTLPDKQISAPESEPETVYLITDVKSNISGKTSLSGIKLTVDRYSGVLLYVNYTIKPGNNLYQNSDYTLQKLVNGQWTDVEQLREIDAGKTTDLARSEKYTYSLPEYYHLDKYFNNPEDGRYKIKPVFCTDIDLKISVGYEIEFTVTKHTVKEASVIQKIKNPIAADFCLTSYSTDYTYTLFDSSQLVRVTQLYNDLKLTPIEKPTTLYGSYYLTVIDGNGYKHSLILYNNGIAVSNGGNYYFAENGSELFDYLDSIYMNS